MVELSKILMQNKTYVMTRMLREYYLNVNNPTLMLRNYYQMALWSLPLH